MDKDRDMTYAEMFGLLDRLIELGVLLEDDVVMRFMQQPGVDFAFPILYAMKRERVSEMVRQASPGASDADADSVVGKCSVKSWSEQLRDTCAGRLDENIGLLDFKNADIPEDEKFGGYFTTAGLMQIALQSRGLVGEIDGQDEKSTAVFCFRLFNDKWIPVIAKLPEDEGGVRSLKLPDRLKEKFSECFGGLNPGEVAKSSLSAMDPEIVEFLETARNPHLYDAQNSISGS